jgi:Domain of unknown function (DUF6456)
MKERNLANRLLEERSIVSAGAGTPALSRSRAKEGTRRLAGRSVTVNVAESPLGWLKARGHVDARQYDAGEQLRRDWELAQLAPATTMRWDAAPPAPQPGSAEGRLTPSEAQLAARQRFDGAVVAAGPGLGDILWRIVCAGEGMRDVERALGWPARAGKVVLCLALDRLADHYGMR